MTVYSYWLISKSSLGYREYWKKGIENSVSYIMCTLKWG